MRTLHVEVIAALMALPIDVIASGLMLGKNLAISLLSESYANDSYQRDCDTPAHPLLVRARIFFFCNRKHNTFIMLL